MPAIYLTTVEPYSGKSLISLGITELMLRQTGRVGIFRPIINCPSAEVRDKNIELLLEHFQLKLDYQQTYAYLRHEANALLAEGRQDELLDGIIARYKALEATCDFILVIGSDFVGDSAAFELRSNATIAHNLGCPVLIVALGVGRNVAAITQTVQREVDAFQKADCQLLGVIVNQATAAEVEPLQQALQARLAAQLSLIAVIPEHRVLSSPTLRDIAEHLDAKVLYGADRLNQQVYDYQIAAMHIHHFLPKLRARSLVITPGDRSDVILGTLQAHSSHNYPSIAGLLLTNDLTPAPSIAKLLAGTTHVVPVLAVAESTYHTAAHIGDIRSYLSAQNQAKIAFCLKLFEQYVDSEALRAQISQVQLRGLTPKMFQFNLVQRAKTVKKHIVLPEGASSRPRKFYSRKILCP